jgi:cytochrome b6-f complex iron-sulfur subunit
MSDTASGGGKKLTTSEILAAARAQAGQSAGSKPAPAVELKAEKSPAPAAAAPAPVATPAANPTSTADILAAARAQSAKANGGDSAAVPAAAKPASPAPAGAPKSTAEILAAARAAAAAKAGGAATVAAAASMADKPKSTADILAAARAAKTGGAAANAPAKIKPAPKAALAEASADSREKIPVAEMLAKLRAGETVSAATAAVASKPAEVAPAPPLPMPVKPQPAAKLKKPVDEQRRSMLVALIATPFAAAWTVFSATMGVWTLATARFMFPNIITEPPRKFKIGPPSDFDLGTVATKFVASSAIWIVHTDQYKGKSMIYALSSVCTHLGCTPSWLEGEQKFKCPCHGSGFYITGVNFEGPAPRPLERHGIRLAADGMLEVDKSVKFQEEMGQWDDPASYLEVI